MEIGARALFGILYPGPHPHPTLSSLKVSFLFFLLLLLLSPILFFFLLFFSFSSPSSCLNCLLVDWAQI